MALISAPLDAIQGAVQRIFYLHLSAFGGAGIGFGAAVIGGIVYLRTRRVWWDMLALAGVEVGLMLAVVTVTTGSIWARPICNSWWTWDPKLTSAAIMALTYAAYLMLRSGIDGLDRQRRFASVFGIIAFVSVVNMFTVSRVRPDTLHDPIFGPGALGGGLPAAMQVALFVNLFVWAGLVAPALIGWRLRLERRRLANEVRRWRLLDRL
jgi:heme exporter protein C